MTYYTGYPIKIGTGKMEPINETYLGKLLLVEIQKSLMATE